MDKVVNNNSNQPEEKDAIPSHIFIPVFSVLGVAIICAIITLIILLRRDSRRNLRERARRAGRRATNMFSPLSSKQSRSTGGTLNKSTIEELSYHLPTNRQRAAPSRRPSLLPTSPSAATPPSATLFTIKTNNRNTNPETNTNLLKAKAKASDQRKRRGGGDRSRPNTGNSAYSEAFMRPWNWRKPKPVVVPPPAAASPVIPISMSMAAKLSPTRLLAFPKATAALEVASEEAAAEEGQEGASPPTFWVEEQHPAGQLDPEVDWRPPTEWDIAGPITGGDITAPAVPMPAFLKPHMPVDPRSIDPSSFPLPAQDQVGPLGRWSSSQRSSLGHPGGQHLSVGGDSMFCTCDLDGIMEEDDESYRQAFGSSSRGHETPRVSMSVSMSGSSIQASAGKCRACMRRSATANAIAVANQNQSTSPTSTLFSRASSIRKSRRKRKQEISSNSKIAVAGRLYKEG